MNRDYEFLKLFIYFYSGSVQKLIQSWVWIFKIIFFLFRFGATIESIVSMNFWNYLFFYLGSVEQLSQWWVWIFKIELFFLFRFGRKIDSIVSMNFQNYFFFFMQVWSKNWFNGEYEFLKLNYFFYSGSVQKLIQSWVWIFKIIFFLFLFW
jgi:hypothetical protein